jgi:hypothetical protein
VGFDQERRNQTEQHHYPRDQAGIPKESIDHGSLFPARSAKYTRTIANLNNSRKPELAEKVKGDR